jgi:hypothetical protein
MDCKTNARVYVCRLGNIIMTTWNGNSKNKTSQELQDKKYRGKMLSISKYAGWYEDFMENYQFKMTYSEYKKKRNKGKL